MLKIAGVKPLIERVQLGPMPSRIEDVTGELIQLQKQMAAATKGLGLANRLPPGSREKHKSAVFSNLNIIGNRLRALTRAFQKQAEPAELAPAPEEQGQGEV